MNVLWRRCSDHIRRQDWLAVGIDFVIVVVGVFIGIQVSNWNENLAQRDRSERMLTEFVSDLSEVRLLLSEQRDFYYQNAVAIDELIASLEADRKVLHSEIKAVFQQGYRARILPGAPDGLDELLVAARLDLLDRGAVRDALSALAKQFSISERASDELLIVWQRTSVQLEPYISIKRTPNPDGRLSYFSISAVDIESIWSSDEGRIAMRSFFTFHANMQFVAQGMVDAIDEVIAIVSLPSQELKQPIDKPDE